MARAQGRAISRSGAAPGASALPGGRWLDFLDSIQTRSSQLATSPLPLALARHRAAVTGLGRATIVPLPRAPR